MISAAACLVVMLVLHLLTPYWWWVMVVPFAFGAAFGGSGWKAFRTGFVSAGTLWAAAAAWFYLSGAQVITARTAAMFKLGSPVLMIAAAALTAAVAAGVSGCAGFAVRSLVRPRAVGLPGWQRRKPLMPDDPKGCRA